MLEQLLNTNFEYKRLTESEQKTRGILGRLIGIIADTKNPTRNGRKYSSQLWENVFNNPIMKEKISNRVCFGELGHPADRTETDMEKIAICLAEQPKKGKDGALYGVFDILSTPNGRILKALCDYGCNIGISSRGQGDLITDENGDEAVDPDTYDCECFDAVLIPGVENARLKYVTESLDTKKSLNKILTESLDSATENERKIMKETLDNLNIELTEDENTVIEETPIEEVEDTVTDVEDNVIEEPEEGDSIEVVPTDAVSPVEENEGEEKDPSEVFLDYLANNFDEKQIKKVCKILDIEIEDDGLSFIDDEEDEDEASDEDEEMIDDEVEEEGEKSTDEESDDIKDDDAKEEDEKKEEAVDEGFSNLVNTLKEAIKGKSDLENKVKELQEKLAVSDAKVSEINEECNKYKNSVTRLSKLTKLNKDASDKVSALEEQLSKQKETIENQKVRINRLVESKKETVKNSRTLTENMDSQSEKLTKLNEELKAEKSAHETEVNNLNEKLSNLNTEKNTEIEKLTESLNKQTSIKESYKKLANKAVNKYIEVKADILGVNTRDIKRKLGESYTMEDVDQVCEDLKSYQLNVSRLPFSLDKKVSIKVNENKANKFISSKALEDDDVDDSLIKLANY